MHSSVDCWLRSPAFSCEPLTQPHTSAHVASLMHAEAIYTDNAKTVGQRIRERRFALGMTQYDVARAMIEASGQRAFVADSTVTRWEAGTHHVSLRYRLALADVLGLTVAELFG